MNLHQLTTLNGLDKPSFQLGKKVVKPVAALFQPTSVLLKPGLSVDSNGRMSYVPPERNDDAFHVPGSYRITTDGRAYVFHGDESALQSVLKRAVFEPKTYLDSPEDDGWYVCVSSEMKKSDDIRTNPNYVVQYWNGSRWSYNPTHVVRYWNGSRWSYNAYLCSKVSGYIEAKDTRALHPQHLIRWVNIRIIGPDTPENREAGLS